MKRHTLRSLKDPFETAIRVHHVMEPLRSVDVSQPLADAERAAAAAWMDEHGLDVLGARRGGRVVGYLARGALDDVARFDPHELISDSTPLLPLLRILEGIERVFVLEHNQVIGIVTRADLGKAPVRLFFFGLVTLLEMHLLELVKGRVPSWPELLSPSRRALAERLFEERRARGQEIGLVECLQLCDKRDIVLRHEGTRALLGFSSRKEGQAVLDSAELLRNQLAHGQPVDVGTTWPEVVALAMRVEAIIERCEEAAVSP